MDKQAISGGSDHDGTIPLFLLWRPFTACRPSYLTAPSLTFFLSTTATTSCLVVTMMADTIPRRKTRRDEATRRTKTRHESGTCPDCDIFIPVGFKDHIYNTHYKGKPLSSNDTIHRCSFWPDCEKWFFQRSNLATHEKTHTRTKDLRCPHLISSRSSSRSLVLCDSKFGDPGSLTRHRKRRHGYVPKSRTATDPWIKNLRDLGDTFSLEDADIVGGLQSDASPTEDEDTEVEDDACSVASYSTEETTETRSAVALVTRSRSHSRSLSPESEEDCYYEVETHGTCAVAGGSSSPQQDLKDKDSDISRNSGSTSSSQLDGQSSPASSSTSRYPASYGRYFVLKDPTSSSLPPPFENRTPTARNRRPSL
ncbi:unnamed protein product [Somion occarium]|uniref:C2H2-type domain-containing protein n=1 Tax=Somion occarium TaxID=3059160 RepID=A0ABP1DMW8_9APHY